MIVKNDGKKDGDQKMKITHEQLTRIINEEIQHVLNEKRYYNPKVTHSIIEMLRAYAQIGESKFRKVYERMVYVADQIEEIERSSLRSSADIQRRMEAASISDQFEKYLNDIVPLRRLQKTGVVTNDFTDPSNLQEISNSALHVSEVMKDILDDSEGMYKKIAPYISETFVNIHGMEDGSEKLEQAVDNYVLNVGKALGMDEEEAYSYGGTKQRSFLSKAKNFFGFEQ